MTKSVIFPLFALFFPKKEDFVLFSLFIVLDIVFVLVYNGFTTIQEGAGGRFMKEIKQHSHKKTVLLQWIITGIIILLIPFISIVINFVIGRNIINKQAGSSNRLILSHMKDAIDDKLKSIRNLSYLLLLDNDILELSAASGEDDFWSKTQLCYEKLENYTYIYNDMNIIIYYPARDYILTSGVSNSAASIYKAIKYSYSGESPPMKTG